MHGNRPSVSAQLIRYYSLFQNIFSPKEFSMKKLFPLALLLLFLGFGQTAQAQDFTDLDKSPMDMAYYPPRAAFRAFAKTEEEKKAAEPVIRVIYSRPQKKGRDIFGGLEELGKAWRVGANESTEILFFKHVKVNGQVIPAGRYTLYATPGEEEWEVSINTDLDGWGAYAYNAENNVASITVPVEKAEDTIEAFSIVFEKAEDGAHMIMGWDKTMVRVPIQF